MKRDIMNGWAKMKGKSFYGKKIYMCVCPLNEAKETAAGDEMWVTARFIDMTSAQMRTNKLTLIYLIVPRRAQKVALPRRRQQVPLVDNQVIRQARAAFSGGGSVERRRGGGGGRVGSGGSGVGVGSSGRGG
jgi:hypothetical protein